MEISIIIPFHKGRHYLEDCLESVAEQKGVLFETILVLDHVEEEIGDLTSRFGKLISLRLIELKERRGVAAARNRGLLEAAGDYVFFLDSDDYLLDDSLLWLVRTADGTDADIVRCRLAFTWYKRRFFLEREEGKGISAVADGPPPGEDLAWTEGMETGVPGILFKRSLIERGGLCFCEELTVYTDLPFLAGAFHKAECFETSPCAVYVKRFHNDPIQLPSLSQKAIPDRHIQYMKSFLLARKACGGDEEIRSKLEAGFFAYFIALYQKSFFPKKGRLLPGTQFKTVCGAMRQCDRKNAGHFGKKERKLLDGFFEEREGKCIFYGACSMGFAKFKKSKTKRTAIYRMIERFLFSKLPIKENWIVFESYLGKNYADSCKYIYRCLEEGFGRQYKYIWAVGDLSTDIPGPAVKVRYMGLMHFYYTARAKYWVNNMRQPVWKEKRRGQVFLETWHGTPLKKLVFDMEDVHSATATYKADFYRQSRQWDYLLSDNPFSTNVFESAFLFPREKILERGYPRNDILHWEGREERAGRIRDKLGIPRDKKAILYAPTWRDDEYYGPGQYKFRLALDLGQMQRILGEEYVLLIRTHYFIADKLDFSQYKGFVWNVSRYGDVSEIYLISDLCITDYSSVFFDYANLRRPLLFYTYDLEKYRDVLRGFYIDMEKEVPGPLLYTTEDVIDAVLHIDQVEEDFRERYDAFYRKYCCWDDGHASERIVKDVFGGSNEEKNESMD